jgi:HPr kinase/phosphorylase
MSAPLHASCVSVEGMAVLLLGPSGVGKSDLALRLIDGGAELIADDYVELNNVAEQLWAYPPASIAGKLELRGVGIVTLPHTQGAVVKLAVQCVPREQVERLPEPQFFSCQGVEIPLLSLHAHDASTPAKIRFALRELARVGTLCAE